MEERIAHSVGHPIRLDALSVFFEREASPKEIAELLRVSVPTASHHVKELFDEGMIELVKTVPRRGAIEHYYRAKERPEVSDEEWNAMPRPTRRSIAALALQAIVTEALASLRHRKMEADDDLHLAWMPMALDDRGRREVSELQAEMLARLEEVKARNVARQTEAGESERAEPPRIVVMMGFDRGTRRPARRRVL